VVYAYNPSYSGDSNRKIMVGCQYRQKLVRIYFKTSQVGVEVHACGPSYSRSRGARITVQYWPRQKCETLCEKQAKRTEDMAEVIECWPRGGPELNFQYCQKKRKEEEAEGKEERGRGGGGRGKKEGEEGGRRGGAEEGEEEEKERGKKKKRRKKVEVMAGGLTG
jgi:hypothetical protein